MSPGARGSVSIVAATGALLLSLTALAAADLGSLLHARARAQAAADAAALAAGTNLAPVLGQGGDPEGAARQAAALNGATFLRCACTVGTTEAEVEVEVRPALAFLRGWFGRRARAVGRATLEPAVLSYREAG